jgi:hypothetical protein
MSLRELGHPPALDAALAYLDLLAEQKPEELERACVRWHGRLETEATFCSLESRSSHSSVGEPLRWRAGSVEVLRRVLRRVRPTLVRGTAD